MFVPSDCFNKRSNWWRIVFTTMTSFITWRYDSMSMASCSPSSRGGSAVNGGLSETQRVNDLLKKSIFSNSNCNAVSRNWLTDDSLDQQYCLHDGSVGWVHRVILEDYSDFSRYSNIWQQSLNDAFWVQGEPKDWPLVDEMYRIRNSMNMSRCLHWNWNIAVERVFIDAFHSSSYFLLVESKVKVSS